MLGPNAHSFSTAASAARALAAQPPRAGAGAPTPAAWPARSLLPASFAGSGAAVWRASAFAHVGTHSGCDSSTTAALALQVRVAANCKVPHFLVKAPDIQLMSFLGKQQACYRVMVPGMPAATPFSARAGPLSVLGQARSSSVFSRRTSWLLTPRRAQKSSATSSCLNRCRASSSLSPFLCEQQSTSVSAWRSSHGS